MSLKSSVNKPCFMIDHMVVRLGKYLRIIGYDAEWDMGVRTHDLIQRANVTGRFFVTRNTHLAEQYPQVRDGIVLSETDPVLQFRALVDKLGLDTQSGLFSRCIRCNVALDALADKRVAEALVHPNVYRRQDRFFRCPHCGTIFWHGSHVANTCAKLGLQHDDDVEWQPSLEAMVKQLRLYHIKDERILAAMGRIQRHRFIPAAHRSKLTAYGNHPWMIGYDQTISQPFIVAYMTERLKLSKGEKVLEIGTGSGYQAAVLAELCVQVYSIEIIPELADHARTILEQEGYGHVNILTGNGYKGWPEHSPFDAIIATCAPDNIPGALVDQLREGGHMILPVGSQSQRLVLLKKTRNEIQQEDDIAVCFVPMVHACSY